MHFKAAYWKNNVDEPFKEVDVEIEFDKQEDFDWVPYGEGKGTENRYVEYDVTVNGDLPKEIKDVIKDQFGEYKRYYHGVTDNFEFELEIK